jgi:outer membrane lipoprotein carrier protein
MAAMLNFGWFGRVASSLGPAVLALAVPGAGADVPASAVSEARLVEAALGAAPGFVATFTQTVVSPGLPSPQVEKGTVYVLRPGRMRWEYTAPKGKLAVADGARTWVYLPEERQVIAGTLAADESGDAVAFLMRDRVDLVGRFAITWGPPGEDGARRLMLTPRSERAPYRHLLVEPDRDHLVRSLTVVDPLDNTVTYRFTDRRVVATLDEALFRFRPPADVDVQEMPPR